MAIVIMVYATKEDQYWVEFWIFMALLMQNRLEIWVTKDLQVGMCLTYLKVQSVG